MVTIIDLNAELAKLTMLRERTPEMTSAQREGSAAQLVPIVTATSSPANLPAAGLGNVTPTAMNWYISSMARLRLIS